MYVCVCAAVSDKTIRRAIGAGACSLRALKDELGVAARCGCCIPELRRMLAPSGPAVEAAANATDPICCLGARPALGSQA